MRLDELQDVLTQAEEIEDAALVALASYGSRGGGDPAEFDAMLRATTKARAATAAAYAAWKTAADRAVASGTVACVKAAGLWTNVYPFERSREAVAAPSGATHTVSLASLGIATANDGDA